MAVHAGHPSCWIRAPASSKLAVHHIELVWLLSVAGAGVRDTWVLLPLNNVATGGAGTMNAEDGIIAPHKVVGAMNTMPRVPFPHVDASGIVAI